MITIFNGRSRAIGNSKESVFIQVDALMREYFYVFKNGHDINAAGVFMVVALHADINGWAWPSTTLLCKETGLSTTDAVLRCIQHLRTVEINNEPILHHYRTKQAGGQWGRSYYHVFPTAGGGENRPTANLVLWNPPPAKQCMAKLDVDQAGNISIDSLEEEPLQAVSATSAEDEFTSALTKASVAGKPVTRDEAAPSALQPKPKPERKRDPLFDALGNVLFDIRIGDPIGKGEAGRIAAVKKELLTLDANVTAADISRFANWYKGCYPNVSIPRDAGKLATHWRQWRATTSSFSTVGTASSEGETRFVDGNWMKYTGGTWSQI